MVMVAWVDELSEIEVVEVEFTVTVIDTQICEVFEIIKPE